MLTVSNAGHFSITQDSYSGKQKLPIFNSFTFGHFSNTKDPVLASLKQLSSIMTLFKFFTPTIFRLFANWRE